MDLDDEENLHYNECNTTVLPTIHRQLSTIARGRPEHRCCNNEMVRPSDGKLFGPRDTDLRTCNSTVKRTFADCDFRRTQMFGNENMFNAPGDGLTPRPFFISPPPGTFRREFENGCNLLPNAMESTVPMGQSGYMHSLHNRDVTQFVGPVDAPSQMPHIASNTQLQEPNLTDNLLNPIYSFVPVNVFPSNNQSFSLLPIVEVNNSNFVFSQSPNTVVGSVAIPTNAGLNPQIQMPKVTAVVDSRFITPSTNVLHFGQSANINTREHKPNEEFTGQVSNFPSITRNMCHYLEVDSPSVNESVSDAITMEKLLNENLGEESPYEDKDIPEVDIISISSTSKSTPEYEYWLDEALENSQRQEDHPSICQKADHENISKDNVIRVSDKESVSEISIASMDEPDEQVEHCKGGTIKHGSRRRRRRKRKKQVQILHLDQNVKIIPLEPTDEYNVPTEKQDDVTDLVIIDDEDENSNVNLDNFDNASYDDLIQEYNRIQAQLRELNEENLNNEFACDVNCDEITMDIASDNDKDDDLLELRRLALQSKKPKPCVTETISPDSISPTPNNLTDEESDEVMLRAQLLQSLNRKKEEIGHNTRSQESTPGTACESELCPDSSQETVMSASATCSRSDAVVSVSKSSIQKSSRHKVLNKQKEKFVINFGEDSTDDEGCESNEVLINHKTSLPDLDIFLKEARKKSVSQSKVVRASVISSQDSGYTPGVVKTLSLAQQEEYNKLKSQIEMRETKTNQSVLLKNKEDKWLELKTNLLRKRVKLRDLKNTAVQKRQQLANARIYAKKMQEHYLAATRVVNSTTSDFNKLQKELKKIEAEVLIENSNAIRIENDCVKLGTQVQGSLYKLPEATKVTVKRAIHDDGQRKRLRTESENRQRSSQEITEEKNRLQERERIVGQRIQSLKKPMGKQLGADSGMKTVTHKAKSSQLVINSREKLQEFLKDDQGRVITNRTLPIDYVNIFKFNKVAICGESVSMWVSSFNTQATTSLETTRPLKWESDRSVLIHLHSYRLRSGVSLKKDEYSSYANNIHPHEYLCRFDLMGTCNDKKCNWQHKEDYLLNDVDKLVDILLYRPSVAGVIDAQQGLDVCRSKLRQFVERFLSKNKMLDFDQSYRLLKKLVRDSIKTNVALATRCIPRCTRLKPVVLYTFSDFKYKFKLRDRSLVLNYAKILQIRESVNPDICLKRRFFAPEGRPISSELETTLASDPSNIQLWIKLAYYHVSRLPNKKSDCVNRALNVMSRALEFNGNNQELWEHFLFLYSNRVVPDSEDEKFNLFNICQKAIHFCPCYRTWEFYISICMSFKEKDKATVNLQNSILNDEIADTNLNDKSLGLLQTLLYRVRLYIEVGLIEEAKQIMRSSLVKSSVCSTPFIADRMSNFDKVFAWLLFVHLMSFNSFPCQYFEPFRQRFSHLVDKRCFVIDWSGIDCEKEQLICGLFKEAIEACGKEADQMATCLPLYFNLSLFELNVKNGAAKTASEIVTLLKSRIGASCQLQMFLSNALFTHNFVQETIATLTECTDIVTGDVDACYSLAHLFFITNEMAQAKLYLRKIIENFYTMDAKLTDLNAAYRVILTDDVTSIEELQLKNNRTGCTKSVKLWLCYILLQFMEKCLHSEVERSFQMALTFCKLQEANELETYQLWWHYVEYSSHNISSQSQFEKFGTLVRHASLTNPDLTFQMNLVNYYLKFLSTDYHRLTALIEFSNLLPDNFLLLRKTIDLALKLNEEKKFWSVINYIVSERKYSSWTSDIWFTVLGKAITCQDHAKAHRFIQLSLPTHVYNIRLWKLAYTYESSLDHVDHIKEMDEVISKLSLTEALHKL